MSMVGPAKPAGRMIPVGYMAKYVSARPEWLLAPNVADICSVSGCVSEAFADYILFWAHNGFWLFNSPTEITQLAKAQGIDLAGTTLFYYEALETEFDEETRDWRAFEPEASFDTRVEPPTEARLIGFDVLTFASGNEPGCSPLSCNHVAAVTCVNSHCLFDRLDEAIMALEGDRFAGGEPGPYRVFAVYMVGDRTP